MRSRWMTFALAAGLAGGLALVERPVDAQSASGAGNAGQAQDGKLKVHISVDMEGVAGAVTADQLGPAGFEYGRFREFMTEEALAALTGAQTAGATDFVIVDSHGNGENLLIEKFPQVRGSLQVIRSFPRPLGMMAGVDQDIDAAIFIGYHSSTNNPAGVRAHTFSSATLTRVAVNGVEMSEGAWNAAIAGHFGVPVIMISGDDAAAAEVSSVVGDMEQAEVKKSLGFHSAMTVTPEAARRLIQAKVQAALKRRASFKPYVVKTPVTVDVSFKHYMPAEVLSYLPSFERTGSHAIRFVAKDMVEASRVMTFIGAYQPDLTP